MPSAGPRKIPCCTRTGDKALPFVPCNYLIVPRLVTLIEHLRALLPRIPWKLRQGILTTVDRQWLLIKGRTVDVCIITAEGLSAGAHSMEAHRRILAGYALTRQNPHWLVALIPKFSYEFGFNCASIWGSVGTVLMEVLHYVRCFASVLPCSSSARRLLSLTWGFIRSWDIRIFRDLFV